MSPPAPLLLLNGASSSGKTALARALQRQSPLPYHHIQLDTFRAMEPPGYWDGWESRDEASIEQMMGALCGAMYAAAIQFSRHGQRAILDVALTNPHARRLLVDHLAGWPVYLIGVHCAPDELARREQARGDRTAGLAASQVEWIHKRVLYDIEIDTTLRTPEDLAADLLARLGATPLPSSPLESRVT